MQPMLPVSVIRWNSRCRSMAKPVTDRFPPNRLIARLGLVNKETRNGIAAGVSASLLWGLLPVYWKTLGVVPPLELLSWRVAGCSVFAWLFIFFRRRPLSRKVRSPRVIGYLILASLLIGVNWGVFIWIVATERILEASLGYYITPLVNVLLGVIFFSERLGRIRYIAIFLTLIGVVLMTLDTGIFPWLSILLAVMVGFYGMAVKQLPLEIDSIEVLAWETALLGPIAAAYLVVQGFDGFLHFSGYGSKVTILLILAGIATLAPLWLYGIGVKRIPLSALGFLQFIAPTMMLLLGVLVYGEPFGIYRGIAFTLVASAMVLYTISLRHS